MNTMIKTVLLAAVLATGAFAQEGNPILELQNGGTIEVGATVVLNGQNVVIKNRSELYMMGRMEGNGTIDCQDYSSVYVRNKQFAEATEENAAAIKEACGHAENDSIQHVYMMREDANGYLSPDITVNPSSQLRGGAVSANILAYMPSVDPESYLFYVAGINTDPRSNYSSLICTGGDESPVEVAIALGNTDANVDGCAPSSLFVNKKLIFSGDNTGFTEKEVRIGQPSSPALPGEVEYTTADSVLQVPTTVAFNSKLTFPEEEVTLKNDLTIKSTQDACGQLIFRGKVTIPSGVTLTLGDANCPFLYLIQ